jgi:hypothetical protein
MRERKIKRSRTGERCVPSLRIRALNCGRKEGACLERKGAFLKGQLREGMEPQIELSINEKPS